MKKATIVFCFKYGEILLGMKKRGFGVNKWNGFGGKVGENEEVKAAAIREMFEESGIKVQEAALYQVAKIQFWFEDYFVFEGHIFFTGEWEGEAKESEEMKPQWYLADKLPFDEMWVDDRFWLPLVLSGKRIEASCKFNADGTKVKNFIWKEVEFD